MTTNDEIKKDIQKLNVGSGLVEMFSIDATNQGGDIYYFTPMTEDGGYVTFNGIEYAPLPLETDGFEQNGEGQMPRPILRVSNVNLVFIAAVISFNDFIGCKVTRMKTFKKYLDNQSEANPSAVFPQDIFYIERKVKQNKFVIEWELKAAIDIERVLVPKGQVLEICTHRYRSWNDDLEAMDYSEATCPFTKTRYYTEEGIETFVPSEDKCGKKLFDCKLRYSAIADQLPGYFFPGVGKLGYPYRR